MNFKMVDAIINMSDEQIIKSKNVIDWNILSRIRKLSKNILFNYTAYLNLERVIRYQKELPYEFLFIIANKNNIRLIRRYQFEHLTDCQIRSIEYYIKEGELA